MIGRHFRPLSEENEKLEVEHVPSSLERREHTDRPMSPPPTAEDENDGNGSSDLIVSFCLYLSCLCFTYIQKNNSIMLRIPA